MPLPNRSSIAYLAACIALAASPALHAAKPLEGRAFVVEIGYPGEPAFEKDDVLSFREGLFHSSMCDKLGYGRGAYRADERSAGVTFTAETSSEKEGRLAWRGTIDGDAIEGAIIHYRKPWWLNPDPAPREMWFRGRVRR